MSNPVTSENTTAETQGQGCIAPGRFYPCPDLPEPVPASAAPAGTEPVPPERNGTVMNHSHATGQQRRAEELVSWTCGERIRFLWYRLRLTVQEIIIANRVPDGSDTARQRAASRARSGKALNAD
jgi:hypothetical protein